MELIVTGEDKWRRLTQRMRRTIWVSVACLASLVLLLSAWIVNRHDTPPVPSTTVSALFVHAKLPGTNWQLVQAEPTPGPDYDLNDGVERAALWETTDKSIFFRVVVGPDSPQMGALDNETATQVSNSSLMGFLGTSVEAVSAGANSYHKVEYIFHVDTVPNSYYFVAAGATNAAWKKGAGDTVYSILRSVTMFQK